MRNNLVVRGILLEEDENPVELSIKIGKITGVGLIRTDIDATHRFPSRRKTDSPPLFIIKMKNCLQKTRISRNDRVDERKLKVICLVETTKKNSL